MADEPTQTSGDDGPTPAEITEAIAVAAQLEIDRRRAQNERAAPNN